MKRFINNLSQGNIRSIIAIITVLFSFAYLFCLLFVSIPAANKEIVSNNNGLLLAAMTGTLGYYFGSSKNESDKAKVEQTNLQNPPPPQTQIQTVTTEIKQP